MEMAYVVLWLFGGLLYLQFTFACDEDSDCPYAGERCCKSTETGKELAKGICMMRTCGGDVCRSLRSRRLEVVGTRKNGRARRRHARGEEAPARKALENRFPPPL